VSFDGLIEPVFCWCPAHSTAAAATLYRPSKWLSWTFLSTQQVVSVMSIFRQSVTLLLTAELTAEWWARLSFQIGQCMVLKASYEWYEKALIYQSRIMNCLFKLRTVL